MGRLWFGRGLCVRWFATFQLSYLGLPSRYRQLLGALALHPGPNLDLAAGAALADATTREAERSIDKLVDAHLIAQHMPGRYRFHDLVRLFATRIAVAELPDEAREAALDRLLDHYLHAANLADQHITPHRNRTPLDLGKAPVTAPSFEDQTGARRWLDSELADIVAACRLATLSGRPRHAWQLALALGGYFFLAKPWAAWTETHEVALAAAIEAGDRRAEGAVRNRLGLLRLELGDLEAASTHYQRALTLFQELDDRLNTASALANDAWVHHHLGDHQRALHDLRTSLATYQKEGDRRNAAITLRGIGFIAAETGDPASAVGDLERSLEEFNELDLPLDATMALNNLGRAYEHLSDATMADAHYRQALHLGQICGSVFEQARAERGLGDVAAAHNDATAARQHWQRAITHYQTLRAPQAADVEARLADLDRQHGNPGTG